MSVVRDTSIIYRLVTNGRANDLLDILASITKYNLPRENHEDVGLELTKIVSGARRHIQFIAKYGLDKKYVEEGGVRHFPSPEKFQKWLEIGAPGIEQEELDMYLKDKPLEPKDKPLEPKK